MFKKLFNIFKKKQTRTEIRSYRLPGFEVRKLEKLQNEISMAFSLMRNAQNNGNEEDRIYWSDIYNERNLQMRGNLKRLYEAYVQDQDFDMLINPPFPQVNFFTRRMVLEFREMKLS